MKKFALSIITILFCGTIHSHGQDFRPKYYNLGFTMQDLTNSRRNDKRGFGAAITIGRSYILHSDAIAGIVRFGIDATWCDLNVAIHNDPPSAPVQYTLGVGVGPSVHVNPIGRLGLHTYLRFIPSLSRTEHSSTDVIHVSLRYASIFTAGGAISWGMFSLGAEARWGCISCTEPVIRITGIRTYVGLRF